MRALEDIDRWHELFDALCERAGFSDTASLAASYCQLTRGNGQHQFETAVRNLNNWRTGRHIPRQRSMRILAEILGVDEDPNLLAQWNRLYRSARQAEPEEVMEDDMPAKAAPSPGRRQTLSGWFLLPAMAVGALIFFLGMATGAMITSDWRPWGGGPADDAPLVFYEPELQMTVGESRIIHGERGDCGKLPREWGEIWNGLAPSRLGIYSDGGLVRRNSKYCKGITPARGIRFTATAPGTETLHISGDMIKLTVVE